MKVILLTGQTSTGKTDLALKLSSRENGEVINCDSRQIYKNLDIITNKDLPNKDFNKIVSINNFDIGYYKYPGSTINVQQPTSTNIWLYDIVDPKQYFSAFDYQLCALDTIKKVLKNGKTPILVGGTYFYFYYLLYDIATHQIEPDWELRKNLESESVEKLQKILKNIDLSAFENMNNSDRNNPRRLMRRIEILKNNPVPLKQSAIDTIALSKKLDLPNLEIEFIGLHFKEKEDLINAIKKRVEERVQKGAFEEVEELLKRGYTEKDPGLQTIGYKQIIPFLKGKVDKKQAIEDWITKELQYAKRQYTFMKKDPHIIWKTPS